MPIPVLSLIRQRQTTFCSSCVILNASLTVNVCHLCTTLMTTREPSPAFTAPQQSSHIQLSLFLYGLLPGCHLRVLSP